MDPHCFCLGSSPGQSIAAKKCIILDFGDPLALLKGISIYSLKVVEVVTRIRKAHTVWQALFYTSNISIRTDCYHLQFSHGKVQGTERLSNLPQTILSESNRAGARAGESDLRVCSFLLLC